MLAADLKKILNQVKTSAQWVGLRHVHEKNQIFHFLDDSPQDIHFQNDSGLMVEVFAFGQYSYAATANPSLEAVQRAVDLAYQNAETTAPYKIFDHDPNRERPRTQGKYLSPIKKGFDQLQVEAMTKMLAQSCQKMKISDSIVSRSAMVDLTNYNTSYVSTSGAEWEQEMTMLHLNLSATASESGITQTRSNRGGDTYQYGLEWLTEDMILEKSEQIAKEAIELATTAEECPTETMDLVLAPDQMMLQIHESIGHPIELDRILGDERNYAGSSFVKLEDFGHLQYGSELMNVTFDPTVEHELASYAFDDSGRKATKEFLIKDGKLIRGLGGLESESRSKVGGVANFRAQSWNRAPIDRMANLNLEPGEGGSFEEVIAGVENGIYIESNRSWSIDDYRNKFQFGCEYAKKIENGKLTKTLRNPNYRGISSSFWKSLKRVGGPESFEFYGTPYCGKGEPNQVIRVGHGSPVCLFENIEVFGGC